MHGEARLSLGRPQNKGNDQSIAIDRPENKAGYQVVRESMLKTWDVVDSLYMLRRGRDSLTLRCVANVEEAAALIRDHHALWLAGLQPGTCSNSI